LIIAFLAASLAATAVSLATASVDVAPVTVARGVRASPGGSVYILSYYFTSVFQFISHQPINIWEIIYL